MKINVVKNAQRNIFWGLLSKLVALLCPFITRTVIKYYLGSQYLGLGSLFFSIISVLSVTELGFSGAIVYHMYKPVAENDTKLVNALLNFYKKVYRAVGTIILAIGLLLIPFLDKLIEGSYPSDINLTLLYLLYLSNSVVSYFMFAYRSSLIVVYQREDLNSITNMIVTVLLTVCQITALHITHDYMYFALLMPVFTIINNLRIAFIVKKMFPQYKCEGSITKEILQDLKIRISGTVLGKVCRMARNSLDSICISAFIGLAVTAMYNNYYYIVNAVGGLLAVAAVSLTGGIGNHVVVKTPVQNFEELQKVDFLYMNISGWCAACILCLAQPFMYLWMGKDMLLPISVVVLLCFYFYLLKIGDIRSIYVDANGMWWEHRYRSIVEAGLNIALNIILAKYFGLYGIIWATIITILLINQIWGAYITFKHYFGLPTLKKYYRYHLKYASVNILICAATYGICVLTANTLNILTLFIRGILCILVPGSLYYIFYRKHPCFKEIKRIIPKRR